VMNSDAPHSSYSKHISTSRQRSFRYIESKICKEPVVRTLEVADAWIRGVTAEFLLKRWPGCFVYVVHRNHQTRQVSEVVLRETMQ